MVNSSYINRIWKYVYNSVRPRFVFYLPNVKNVHFCFYKPHCCRINRILLNWLNMEPIKQWIPFYIMLECTWKIVFGGIFICGWNIIFIDEEYVILLIFLLSDLKWNVIYLHRRGEDHFSTLFHILQTILNRDSLSHCW